VEPYAFLTKPVKPADLRGAIEMSVYRQAMDRRLRERERWFSTTLDCVADAVVTVDLAGKVTYLNPAAAALLGVSSERALGQHVAGVMKIGEPAPRSGDATPLDTVLRIGKSLRLAGAELVNLSTGAAMTISDTCAPVVVDGKMAGAVMVFHDDTEKRAVARQLETADRLAGLGTMAAGTAHELNNPLAIITSCVENAQGALHEHASTLERFGLAEKSIAQLCGISKALTDAQAAAVRMGRIIAELRSISRPRDQASQAMDLASCIDWAMRATAHEFNNRARVTLRLGQTPLVMADEARLGQVLVNLLVNAAHAIAPGSFEHNEVVITTRTEESGRAVISVHDTGCGMTADVLKRIFDPFFTTKDVGAGMGLGLSISHGIVSSLGGVLRADSTPGAGSTFEILLPPAPAATPAAVGPAASESAGKAAPRHGRILVIDDEAVLLRAITEMLEYDGHTVVTSNNARDALAMIARGERFDVILTDLAMPNMTGMEFFDALLAQDAQLAQRVIFMSGGAVTAKAEKFLEGLDRKHVAKPFKSADLRHAIRQVLAEGNSE
jgi:PAS domain S-box-containing protein